VALVVSAVLSLGIPYAIIKMSLPFIKKKIISCKVKYYLDHHCPLVFIMTTRDFHTICLRSAGYSYIICSGQLR